VTNVRCAQEKRGSIKRGTLTPVRRLELDNLPASDKAAASCDDFDKASISTAVSCDRDGLQHSDNIKVSAKGLRRGGEEAGGGGQGV